ncbi:MAG: cupin domain-containing protein [Bacteroidota bacterium]
MRKPKITSLKNTSQSLLGGSRQVKLSSKETDGDIYLVEGVMPKGSSVPVHIHKFEDEIFHVLEGEVELVLGDDTFIGKVGDIIYLPRGIKHGISIIGEKTAKVLNYVIPGKNFETFFDKMNTQSANPTKEVTTKLAQEYGITFV